MVKAVILKSKYNNSVIQVIQKMSRASNVEGKNKTFTCSTCGKTFDSQQTLDSHMSRDHSVQSESPAGVG